MHIPKFRTFHWEATSDAFFAPSNKTVFGDDALEVRRNYLLRRLKVFFQRKRDDVWRVIVGRGESRFVPFYNLPEDVRANLAYAINRFPENPRPWFKLDEIENMASSGNKATSIVLAKTAPFMDDDDRNLRPIITTIGWRTNEDYYCIIVTVKDMLTIRGIDDGNTRVESKGKSEADTC